MNPFSSADHTDFADLIFFSISNSIDLLSVYHLKSAGNDFVYHFPLTKYLKIKRSLQHGHSSGDVICTGS